MHGLLKRPGYRLYAPDNPEAGALLAEQGLSPADLDRALACVERSEGITVRTIIGVNEDGVFGTSREGWRSDLPDACHEPFIPLLWLKIHELLGRVPAGSTARLIKTARCRARPRAAPPSTGWPAESLDREARTAPTTSHDAAAALRPGGISSKFRPWRSSVASPLLNSCQRRDRVDRSSDPAHLIRIDRPTWLARDQGRG